jgi:predicted ATPase with chaperone activity
LHVHIFHRFHLVDLIPVLLIDDVHLRIIRTTEEHGKTDERRDGRPRVSVPRSREPIGRDRHVRCDHIAALKYFLLIATGQLKTDTSKTLFLGELSLDGSLRHTKGVLPMVLLAREIGMEAVFIPEANAREAAIVDGITIFPAKSLKEVFLHLTNQVQIQPFPYISFELLDTEESCEADMKDIHGQEYVKRAIEVAVAGGHNILLKGPPGAGKTLIAKTLPSILPPLSFETGRVSSYEPLTEQ